MRVSMVMASGIRDWGGKITEKVRNRRPRLGKTVVASCFFIGGVTGSAVSVRGVTVSCEGLSGRSVRHSCGGG